MAIEDASSFGYELNDDPARDGGKPLFSGPRTSIPAALDPFAGRTHAKAATVSQSASGVSTRMSSPTTYRFSFGPWNISTGADPFGPPVRKEMEYAKKLKAYKALGFDAVQFHDDDIVPADLDWQATVKGAAEVKKMLDGEGLFVEIIAPRLWEDPRTIDGGFTSNNPADRKYAIDRAKRCADLAREVDCKNYVLWLAREGTYIREAKCAKTAVARIVDAWNAILEHDKDIRIMGEAKPNEPMDQSYIPTVGHMMAIGYKTIDPNRSGVLIESAHSLLAGLDPADDMAFALYHEKLWSVHLNDQNGLKYDQDKTFGSVDLRRAFNQVWVLEKNGYGKNGECIGLDIKAMRSTVFEESTLHLSNSRTMFLRLLDVVRAVDEKKIEELRANRQYEQLEMYILDVLMGKKA